MSFTGANVERLDGNILKASESDRVICLIAGMTLPSGMAYNTKYELLDLISAERLGITKTHDDTNNELTHYNLELMFGLAPDFAFHLIPIDKTTTVAALVASAGIKAAIRSVESVNVLGVLGLNTLVSASLTDAVLFQSLVTAFETEFIRIDGVFVEGVGSPAAMAVTAYPDLRSLSCRNVHYFVGQDPAVAALKTQNAKRASIGTVLGSVAVRAVHEDLGSVDVETKPRGRKGEMDFSLSNFTLGYWLSAALSDGTIFSSLTAAEWSSLTAKGWMYVGKFAEYDGFFLNGCPGAVSSDSDYAYFNLNSIWNKAARLIRKHLIPRIRSKIPKETDSSGYIRSSWVSARQMELGVKLDSMKNAGNIDGYDIYINPAQSPNETTPLNVKVMLQVGDVVHEFDVEVGLTNKI